MFDVSPHIKVIFDSSFKLIDCNPAAISFMGFKSKEETFEKFSEALRQSIPEFQNNGRASIPLEQRFMTTVKEGQAKFETELVIQGQKLSLDVLFKKIPYGDSFAIIGFVYNITDIVKRERELAEAHEINDLQLVKLNLAMKATNIALWDMEVVKDDPVNPRNVFMWSDEFRHMLGYSDENDFPNLLCSWSDLLHPEDTERTLHAFRCHLTDVTGKTPYDIEYRLLKKNGEYSYYRASGETIRDSEGNAIRVAGALMDITKTKDILFDSEKQRIEAEAASRAKSVFLGTMSHEIRTPMNAIIGMTTIGKLANDIIKKDDALNKIERASKHLLKIINDILDFSKIESGKFELSQENFEFEKMLQRVADIIGPQAAERSQKLYIETGKEMPQTLIGDDQRLSQVITNLLYNAVKFTPQEGTITLSSQLLSETGGLCRIQISIKDTGIGISDAQKAKLFRSFEQAESGTSRKYGGTGLGLAISKRIVELMDGEIKVESKPGEGSKFIITVPFKRGVECETKQAEDELYDDDFSGRTILIAEDVEINREIIQALLEPTNITIEYAQNGIQAVDMFTAAADKYSLIFMDIQMPEMDGLEAARRIRALDIQNAETIPIIAMTANVFREDIEKCFEAGMNGHVGKPIDINHVLGALRQYL